MTHQTVGHAPRDVRDGPLADCPDVALVPPAPEPQCPVDVTLTVLGGRWTPLVLREFLRRGEASYSDLSAALPALSDKVLSDRLSQLVRAGVVERRRTSGWPPRVSYVLTVRGRALEPVVHSMWEWGAGGGHLGASAPPGGRA
ncbi:helix-turn-helix domain-containing protein [Streptomyces sp. NPDC093224]|uniref:winged helix-turn-helix transcriptional regulator n=1 Tax=Streptomyces sp. NPDC093224 TaxID=3155198 RepID=UPI00341322F0